jgi:[protein-PII] uridylyltransferase
MARRTATKQTRVEAAPVPSRAGGQGTWQERRAWLRGRLPAAASASFGADEIAAHFAGMPARYWQHVSEADLGWGLETIHGFLKVVATSNLPATRPIVNWRHEAASARTRVVLCTWDRHGLLAKAAAAFSAVRLNIVEAEAFTRADNIVLDRFSVFDLDSGGPAGDSRLKEMFFLLEGALSEPPRFASVWMCSRHKYLVPAGQPPPRIRFDNRAFETGTLVHVEAADRLGLLYDVLQTLADQGLSVIEARIGTEGQVARESVVVKDAQGQKVLDPDRQQELRRRLEAALTLAQ